MAVTIKESDYDYDFGRGNNVPSVEFVLSNWTSNSGRTRFYSQFLFDPDSDQADAWRYGDLPFDRADIQIVDDISVRNIINQSVDKVVQRFSVSPFWTSVHRNEHVAELLKDYWLGPMNLIQDRVGGLENDLSTQELASMDNEFEAIYQRGLSFRDSYRIAVQDYIDSHSLGPTGILVKKVSEIVLTNIDSYAFIAKVHRETDDSQTHSLGQAATGPLEIDVSYRTDGTTSVLKPDDSNFVYDSNDSHKYVGGNHADIFVMRGGSDNVSAGKGNDYLNGGSGTDTLNGGDGDDLITGGSSRDVLKGGAGHDVFVFKTIFDSKPGASNRDVIVDFETASGDPSHGDVIDLRKIDANTKLNGDQAFKYFEDNDFSHRAQELNFRYIGADTALEGDVNGDGTADFSILIKGHVTPGDTSILG